MTTRPTYQALTETLTSDAGLCAKDAMYFHAFNPNGLYAQLKACHARVDAWVAANPDRPNGVLLVHGSLNDFPWKQMNAGLDAIRKRRDVSSSIHSAINAMSRAIERADAWLADETQWPAPKA